MLVINPLSEYDTDNHLGFSNSQLNELAYKGTTGSAQFAGYIQELANTNRSSYATEVNAYTRRVYDLNWHLINTVNNLKMSVMRLIFFTVMIFFQLV